MDKFVKRVSKVKKNAINALVIGTGFGRLSDLTEIFKSVFVFADTIPEFRSKNIIFRENGAGKDFLTDISIILIDLDQIHSLEGLDSLLHKFHPVVLIEGNAVIGRDLSKPLYRCGYGAVEQDGFYHTWKKLK